LIDLKAKFQELAEVDHDRGEGLTNSHKKTVKEQFGVHAAPSVVVAYGVDDHAMGKQKAAQVA
jgi:hypothetical protein